MIAKVKKLFADRAWLGIFSSQKAGFLDLLVDSIRKPAGNSFFTFTEIFFIISKIFFPIL